MSLDVAFRAAARNEYAEAAAWYEAQRAGLGARFMDEIARCVAAAAAQPELYGVVSGDIRRVVARRFPYSVFFRREAGRIVVLAVFHSSRDPRVWQWRR
jgi:plasmid stabilization system protein ParE